MQTLTETFVASLICVRPADSYKGNFGRILIVGGDHQYGGAAILSASAAVYAGAGLVSVATDPVNFTALHARLPEAMVIDFTAPDLISAIQAAEVIVVGPGLGTTDSAKLILNRVFQTVKATQALIIDGSAITLVAANKLPFPNAQLIWTPHQMEWQRLSGLKIADQTVAANIAAAAKIPGIIVAKRHRTQILAPDNQYENPLGGPEMATGGSGDTLTGIIAAFVGQFHPQTKAVAAAVFVHAKIADEIAQNAYLALPSMVITRLPEMMARLSRENVQAVSSDPTLATSTSKGARS